MANLIGQILLEQFRIEAFVASGGMGAVYRVWDLKRNVPLAMKVLHAELAEDPTVFKRFQREARALQKLAHPNIVPFYGLYQTLDFAFLLERYIDGPNLKDILRQQRGKPLPIEEALTYLKALCAALGYAHANGVIHCDVKPGNVMVDRGGNIYLTDFGIARHAESTTTTMAGAGTPHYMSPEQIRSEAVTPVTDVYALGVVLFEMLTGQRPFRGTEAGTEKGGATAGERVRYAHQHLPPPDPHSLNPAIPEALAQVILKSLEKKPAARFANTQELLATAIGAAGLQVGEIPERVSALPLPAAPEVQPPSPPLPADKPPQKAPPARKAIPWLAGGAGLAVVCVVGIAIIVVALLIGGGSEPSSPQPLPVAQNTPQASSYPDTPTFTLFPTDTPLPPVTPTPALGSTKVSPVDGMVMMYILEGEFLMGDNSAKYPDEKPQHTVHLDAFWIDKTEITNLMFTRFIESTGYITDLEQMEGGYLWNGGGWDFIAGGGWRHPFGPYTNLSGRENHPVIQVSWNDAVAYCQWAGKRLPTEAEWEKASRGPNGNIYPWGSSSPAGYLANYDNNIGDTTEVGSYPDGASYCGALDMGGNVYEWVADWYSSDYYSYSPTVNPTGPASGKYRVLRGGSWELGDYRLHGFEREVSQPGYSNSNIGFRCVSDK